MRRKPAQDAQADPTLARHHAVCACACAVALVAWLLELAGLLTLFTAACSGSGRRAAYAAAGALEPELSGNAFFACAREYKLRAATLLLHLVAWSGCAWAVIRGAATPPPPPPPARGRGNGEDDDDGDAEAPPPPSQRARGLWALPPPPAQPRAPLPLQTPSPLALFAARAAALSPCLCACLALAALCADADLDAGATTAPGVMEWWHALARGARPLTPLGARKYASVQATAAGWVILAACDAAWAAAVVAFASGAGVAGGGGGAAPWPRQQRRQRQQRQPHPGPPCVGGQRGIKTELE